jgi:hypothetical protein
MGMTQYAVASRLVEWFATQPQTVQMACLELYPTEIRGDIAKILLKRFVEPK